MAHPLAGQPAPPEILVNVAQLVTDYYALTPDPEDPAHAVSFGTSGHRGSAFDRAFNEAHILAITQAVCEHRASRGVRGPCFVGMDTHALSEPARVSALEVLAANGVETIIQEGRGYTPTPVVSRAILAHNAAHDALADGLIITPSHNPPRDGGFKYNPPSGGPAGSDETGAIQARANAIIRGGLADVRRIPFARALAADTTHTRDLVGPYVAALAEVVDMDAIAQGGVKLGVDPLGGASVGFWAPIADRYGLDLEITNTRVDPTFGFMSVDKDGKIRMDCSSRYAMAGLVALKDRFDVAFGNDADSDRHGIVTRTGGLMNPNHYLAVAVEWLFQTRGDWPADAAVGKTLVSSAMIDRVAAAIGRRLSEVPVGFKHFVDGLLGGRYGFGGEESAGASFLRRDGRVWTTDKDGIIMDLLAAEMTAIGGKDPSERYADLEARFGSPVYERIDAPATQAQKAALKKLSADAITASTLAGDAITQTLTHAPGNGAAIGGLKVATDSGWFAARPSGTEAIYKIYAESFRGPDHLKAIQADAQAIVAGAFEAAGVAG